MPTIALRETIPTAVTAPAISSRSTTQARRSDRSLEGVLIFSGISFTLAALAVVFHMLNLPSAVMF